jgi:hypothetical protein
VNLLSALTTVAKVSAKTNQVVMVAFLVYSIFSKRKPNVVRRVLKRS